MHNSFRSKPRTLCQSALRGVPPGLAGLAKIMTKLTPEMLHKLLRYEPETGKMYWRHRTIDIFGYSKFFTENRCNKWNTLHAGKEAFTCCDAGGRKVGSIFDRQYKAHRVIWAMIHGYWPEEIDHEDHNPSNNKLGNLRPVPHRQNMKNQRLPKDNKSGFCGVRFEKRRDHWIAKIMVDNREIYLGSFTDKSGAIAARKAANIKYGFHPNHGKT